MKRVTRAAGCPPGATRSSVTEKVYVLLIQQPAHPFADYILLMEKDFVLSAERAVMMREMYTGVQHLARGVHAYRLRGKTDYPAEGMPDCCAPADPPTCPYHSNWLSAGYFSDHMNWLRIFCDPNILENSNGRLVQCEWRCQVVKGCAASKPCARAACAFVALAY